MSIIDIEKDNIDDMLNELNKNNTCKCGEKLNRYPNATKSIRIAENVYPIGGVNEWICNACGESTFIAILKEKNNV